MPHLRKKFCFPFGKSHSHFINKKLDLAAEISFMGNREAKVYTKFVERFLEEGPMFLTGILREAKFTLTFT